MASPLGDTEALREKLRRIDGRGYPAYKELRGAWAVPGQTLFIDHVQGDPFAAPSLLRLRVPMERAGLPLALRDTVVRRRALADALAREVRAAIGRTIGGTRSGSGRSGVVEIDAGAQEVLERSAVALHEDWVEARLQVGLPAAGRRVLGREAARLLVDQLSEVARRALLWDSLPREALSATVACVENQEHVRSQLDALGLIAFIADGSLLPRESGASDRPMPAEQARRFVSPPEHRIELAVPHPPDGPFGQGSCLTGMGLRRGVTLIVGGGYHGKSTLLRALERGVYAHVPGDGREYVVSHPDLVKVRAEDGRSVVGVDIQAFIDRLPGGRSTRHFHSSDASGSTSQAAAIVEALEAGASGLLLDEDTSATNFMVRDARMQALIHRHHEPITPFLERVRELFERHGVSSVLVMGGSGDYFEVADQVIAMRDFEPADVSEEAFRIAREQQSGRLHEAGAPFAGVRARVPLARSLDASRGRRPVKIDARGVEEIRFGEETIDLRGVEQIVDPSQTRAIGYALRRAGQRLMDGRRSLREVLDALESELDARGLDVLDPYGRPGRDGEHPGRLARPRRFEVAAALNRLRSLEVRAPDDELA